MDNPQVIKLPKLDELKRTIDKLTGPCGVILYDVHSPSCVTTTLIPDCGVVVHARWVFGLSGRWSLIPIPDLCKPSSMQMRTED